MESSNNYMEKKFDYNDSKLISVFDELSLWSSYFGKMLLDNIELKHNINLLDVACGNGFPLFELAHRFGSSSNFTGIDIWKAAIDRAKLKQSVYHLPNMNLIVCNAAEMPFENNHFDIITSNIGYNNFNNPQHVFDECSRVLKSGGKIYLTSNVVGHMNTFYRIYEKVLNELGLQKYLQRLHEQEQHRGTAMKISKELQLSGFTIVKTIESSFEFLYIDAKAFFNHSLTVFGFLDGWRSIVDKVDETLVFKILELELNKLTETENEIRMTIPIVYLEAQKLG